jgi:hypothetical protein
MFEILAAATKPQTKCRFTTYRKLVEILQKVKLSNDIFEVQNFCNDIFKIHQQHIREVNVLCKLQNFEDINGLDFNDWAYDTQIVIESAHYKAKSKYYDLHFDKYGFNAY